MKRPYATAIFGLLLVFGKTGGLRAQAPAHQTSPHPPVQKLANPLNDLLEEARKAIDRQDYAAAVEPLQKVLAEEPNFTYAHFQLAYAFAGLGRHEEARKEYQRAVDLDPKLLEGWVNLGLLLLDAEPAAAAAAFGHAVDLQPAQSRPRFLLGCARERSGDLAGAVQAYEEAAKLDPRDYEVAFAYGRTLLRLNRPAQAESNFRTALASRPGSAPARLGLASSLAAQRKPEAVAAFRGYLQLQPGDHAAHLDLARSLYNQGQFPAALAEIEAAETGQQPSLDGLRLRADVLLAQSRWDDAAKVLQRALTLASSDGDLQAALGHAYLEKGDYSSAEKALKAALAREPKSSGALHDLIIAYSVTGDCPRALGAVDQLAAVETPNAGAWFVRGTCYDKMGRAAEAIEAYRKFLELDAGQNDRQDFQARQRSELLTRELKENKR
jgi:Flp pilus assembly protein TadD